MSAGAAPAINDSLADYHCHLQQPRPILMKHIPMVLLRLRRSNRNVCTAVAQLLTKLMGLPARSAEKPSTEDASRLIGIGASLNATMCLRWF